MPSSSCTTRARARKARLFRLGVGGAVLLGGSAWLAFACSTTPEPSATPDAAGDSPVDSSLPPVDASPDTADAADAGRRDARADTGCVGDPGAADAGVDPDAGEDGGDPVGDAAAFTLTQALAGFPDGGGALTARIETELGDIVCRLDEAAAPITVANFVGLARGTRPFRKGSAWTTGKFYDGLLWHRVVPGFVIQGGDPRGTGAGGPGYSIPNENHVAQDEGVLSMAASNPTPTDFEPSGSQYYIVVGRGPKEDYNVFGACTVDVARAIAAVPRRTNDKPTTPVHMKVAIERCPR